ncbi:hypothetical protein NBRC110019_07480 [Neptunitalea chrysea]|uniref:Uncharacterized protein n=2 Tax=Neptunitalea chrysea TaxID=1647581 RepID=A0A9W6ETV3_9FLAO|nr:hypothetical protein NBRC110019_07480 [Neptunitalea chrysea]
MIIEKEITKTITETVHDTVFQVEKDSSYYRAYIDCVNGKPVLKDPESKPGRKLKEPKVNLDDQGNLNVDCEAEAEELFAQWKSTYEKEKIEIEVPVIVPAELSWFQKLYLTMGKLFLIIIACIVGYFIFKIINNIRG